MKDFRRDVANQKKLEGDYLKAETPEEKEKLKGYVDTLKDKLELIVKSITQSKMDRASLAQLAKAMRTVAREIDAGRERPPEEPNKNVNINLNVENLSKEDLISLLNKKSEDNN